MATSGRLLLALLVVVAAWTLLSANAESLPASKDAQPRVDPTPPSRDTCKQCCARTGRRCHFCPPCRPDAFNPCSVVRCPGPGPCVVRDGKAVCLGADEPEPGLAQCPEVNQTIPCSARTQRDRCSSDADCSNPRQRCCYDGCARQCTPTCRPPCTGARRCRLHEVKLPCLGIVCLPVTVFSSCEPPLPDANPCAATRCQEGSTCEVRNGVGVCLLIGDRGGVCPKFERTGYCYRLDNKCDADSECGPQEKCCQGNCGRLCRPSCPNCGSGKECLLETFPPCLVFGPGGCPPPPAPPRATCKPVNPTIGPPTSGPIRQGQCPRDTLITTCEVKADACFSDSQCPEGERCCSRGCGRTCTPVCQNCDGPLRQCVLQQVQCIRAPCPPLAFCRRLPG